MTPEQIALADMCNNIRLLDDHLVRIFVPVHAWLRGFKTAMCIGFGLLVFKSAPQLYAASAAILG